MSVLGLIGTTTQLAELAFKLLKAISVYLKDVSEASSQAAELHHETCAIIGVVTRLKATLESFPDFIPAGQISLLTHAISETTSLLEEMMEKSEALPESAERNTCWIQRALWPFKRKEMEDCVLKLHRYQTTLSSVLQVEQTYFL